MDKVGDRYLLGSLIIPMDDGKLYNGKDLSLQRDVFLYVIESEAEEERQQVIESIGKASSFIAENFMHIMDIGADDKRVYAVMSHSKGNPLLQILQDKQITPQEIFPLVLNLAKGLQTAEQHAHSQFTMTAENIWFSGSELQVINFWSRGDRNRSGTRGLCLLFHQLCTYSTTMPSTIEDYEGNLRTVLFGRGLVTEEQQVVTAGVARSAYDEDITLNSFLERLNTLWELYQTIPASSTTPTSRTTTRGALLINHPDELSEMKQDKTTSPRFVKSKWALITMALLGAAFITGYFIGWVEQKFTTEPQHQQEASNYTTEGNSQEQPDNDHSGDETSNEVNNEIDSEANNEEAPTIDPNRDIDGTNSNTDHTEVQPKSTEAVVIPNLLGLAHEEAEKQAIAAGLHYQFFIEANEVEQGTVFKQDPDPDTQAFRGDSVTFWVSKGNAN